MKIGKSNLHVDDYFDSLEEIEFMIDDRIDALWTKLTKDEVKTLIEHLTNVLNKEH